MTFAQQVLEVLPQTPVGKRAGWVWQRVLGIAAGSAVPNRSELEEHYGKEWLDEVSMDEVLARMASFAEGMCDAHGESAPAVTTPLPDIRVEWLETGHLLVLSRPKETAALINEFARAETD